MDEVGVSLIDGDLFVEGEDDVTTISARPEGVYIFTEKYFVMYPWHKVSSVWGRQ